MIRIQYLANFVGDVTVNISDISKLCMVPPNFFACLGFWGLMDFKQPLNFLVSLLLFKESATLNNK